jgi:hypothetical protein
VLLKAALQEEKHANGRLRADIKLKSQDLKVQEEKVRATEEQRQNVLTRIINRLESIDGKWKTFSNKPRSYSDSVKYSANEWPAKLPTQENRNDTRNFPIPSKDTEQSLFRAYCLIAASQVQKDDQLSHYTERFSLFFDETLHRTSRCYHLSHEFRFYGSIQTPMCIALYKHLCVLLYTNSYVLLYTNTYVYCSTNSIIFPEVVIKCNNYASIPDYES